MFIDSIAGIDDGGWDMFGQEMGAPLALCLITTISTFMDNILLTVSNKVSPLETEEPLAVKLMVSALRRFSANSNDIRVRVEFS